MEKFYRVVQLSYKVALVGHDFLIRNMKPNRICGIFHIFDVSKA